MSPAAGENPGYAMSFAVGGLLETEACIAAKLYLENPGWKEVRTRLVDDNLLQARARSSAIRVSGEVVKRLSTLRSNELELLLDGSPSERNQILWLAICRRYSFIGDFATEVVRDRFLLMQYEIDLEVFDNFVRNKALWHPELLELKESSSQRARSTVLRMLRDAGFLNDGRIQEAIVSSRVRAILDRATPSEIRYFPTYD